MPPPCQTAVYHQFDFWLGQWSVHKADQDQAIASNQISAIMQGCAIQEQYQASSGFRGESLSWYDPQQKQWRQSWSDNAGVQLELAGGLNQHGQMVLQGDQRLDELGQRMYDRITWTLQPDGHVIQLWQSSSDGGKTWHQRFRGRYMAVLPAPPSPMPGLPQSVR